jgi:hypothetical protein
LTRCLNRRRWRRSNRPRHERPMTIAASLPDLPWSYSVLSSFEACPKRHYHTKVIKSHQEVFSDALGPGQEMHKAMENHIGYGDPLPPELERYGALVRALREKGREVSAERRVGVSRDLVQTGWGARDVWLRCVFDVTAVGLSSVVVIDWKTGKPRLDDTQPKVNLIAALAVHPGVKVAKTVFAFVNHDETRDALMSREQLEDETLAFAPRLRRIERARDTGEWRAKEGWACGYCPVHECKYNPGPTKRKYTY